MPLLPTGRYVVLVLAIVVVLAVGATYAVWREIDRSTETFSATCLDIDEIVCSDTVDSIAGFPDLTLHPRPEARVDKVLVRRWVATDFPRTGYGDWATEIALSDGQRIVAGCYYSSDDLVACELGE